jgi:hypothetical protein
LASVSVFIESGSVRRAAPGSEEAAALGTSSAYSTVVQGYRVIAVGEVPPETVRAIAQSIRSAGPAPTLADSIQGSNGAAGAAGAATPAPAAVAGASATGASSQSRAAFGGGGEFSGQNGLPPGGLGRGSGRH